MAWDVIFYATAEGSVPGADKWEAMHGAMGGYYEIRVTGPGRE